MVASLLRIKSDHLEHILDLMTIPDEVEEDLYVDVDWEAIMYVFGNGFVGAPITGEIFMPQEAVGDEEEIKYGGGIRYHTPEVIQKINKMIGDLTKEDLRKLIVPEKMTQVYRFHPDYAESLVERCMQVIALFKRAEQSGDIVVAEIS
ncbi:MAG: DUF1877 family protein [Bacteroidota bacterium]